MYQKSLYKVGGANQFDYNTQLMVLRLAFNADWDGNPAKAFRALDVSFKTASDHPKYAKDLEAAKPRQAAKSENARNKLPGFAGMMVVRMELEGVERPMVHINTVAACAPAVGHSDHLIKKLSLHWLEEFKWLCGSGYVFDETPWDQQLGILKPKDDKWVFTELTMEEIGDLWRKGIPDYISLPLDVALKRVCVVENPTGDCSFAHAWIITGSSCHEGRKDQMRSFLILFLETCLNTLNVPCSSPRRKTIYARCHSLHSSS